MKHNVGSYDAAARAVLGFAIIGVGHHLRSWWGVAGLAPLLSSAFAFCPLYWLAGFNTCYQDLVDDRVPSPSNTKKV